jgi:hypothetical protein
MGCLRKPLGIRMATDQHGDAAVAPQCKRKGQILMPKEKDAGALENRKTWVGRRIDVQGLELQRIHPRDEPLG